jgi:hypothetical protein
MRTLPALAVAALTLAALVATANGNPVIDPGPGQPAPRPQDWRVPNPPGPRLVLRAGVGDDKQTHLRLPAALAKNWRADAARPAHGPTVAAGVALALGLVTGGLWLARTGRRRLLLSGAALGVTALLVVGVSGCPWDRLVTRLAYEEEILAPPACAPDGNLTGEALLEIDPQTDRIEVVVNRAELAAWAEQAAKPVPPPPDAPPTRPGVRLVPQEQRSDR